MKIREAVVNAASVLERQGIESAGLEAGLLIEHVTGVRRLELSLESERVLTAGEEAGIERLVAARSSRIPLQHLLGSVSFCGTEIEVSPDALIPRPETELLAEEGWKFLKSAGAPGWALDFGTGTGCIAIVVAQHAPAARVIGLDVSGLALALAARNARRHGLGPERLHFLRADGLAAFRACGCLDLILANPPYIPSAEIANLAPEVRDHDPRQALDGGADGLGFYRHLAGRASGLLREGGHMMMEIGDGQAEAVRALFRGREWRVRRVQRDDNGVERIVVAEAIKN